MLSAGRPPRIRNKLFARLPRPPLIGFLSFVQAALPFARAPFVDFRAILIFMFMTQ